VRKTTHVFLCRMRPKLSCKNVQDLLSHPATLGEGGEGEIVRVDLAKAVLGLVVVGGLVVTLVREPRPLGLQGLGLEFCLEEKEQKTNINLVEY
jgi:hypothetical protein